MHLYIPSQTQHVKGLISVQTTGVGQFIRCLLLNNS